MGILKEGWREQLKENERERRIFAFILIVFYLLGVGTGLIAGCNYDKVNHENHLQRKSR